MHLIGSSQPPVAMTYYTKMQPHTTMLVTSQMLLFNCHSLVAKPPHFFGWWTSASERAHARSHTGLCVASTGDLSAHHSPWARAYRSLWIWPCKHTCTHAQLHRVFFIFFVVVHAAVAHVAYKLIAMNRCQILTLATHVKPHAADIECKFFSPHLTVCARCSAVHIGLSMLIPYRLLPHNKTLHVLPEYGYICNWKIMCAHFANVFIYFFRWLLFSYLTVNLDANVPHHPDWERDKCIGLMATPCTIHNQHLHCNFQFSMHAKSVSWSDAYSLGSRCGFATYLFFSFSVYMSAAISWSDMTTKCTLQHSIFLFFNFINNEDVLTNDKRLLQKR